MSFSFSRENDSSERRIGRPTVFGRTNSGIWDSERPTLRNPVPRSRTTGVESAMKGEVKGRIVLKTERLVFQKVATDNKIPALWLGLSSYV